MIARDLVLGLDPVALARRLDLEPDAWQVQVLRSSARQIALNCARQTGKSTITAVLGVHQLVQDPTSLILLGAPGLRQAGELYRKTAGFLDVLLREDRPVLPPYTQRSALSLELSSGGRVVCLPGSEKLVRGFSAPSLVVLDEAARIDDALYQSVRPMLATNRRSRLVALSTPAGKRGVYSEIMTGSGDGWLRITVPASACPRISREWLEQERRSIPEHVYASEYECRFVAPEGGIFDVDAFSAAIVPTEETGPHSLIPIFLGRAA